MHLLPKLSPNSPVNELLYTANNFMFDLVTIPAGIDPVNTLLKTL